MRSPFRGLVRSEFRFVPVLISLLVLASPVAACEPEGGMWDWETCWSGSRLAALALAVGIIWFLALHQIFPAMLDPTKSNPRLPRDAFRICVVLWWLFSAGTFLLLFAVLAGELRRGWLKLFPASLSVLNQPWVTAMGGILLVTVILWFVFRPRSTPATR